ncbi:hypothetical protein [Pseudonocardia phyllosphaerae]|uniref:hypothetical protein n=1 Tax=Pseudonocardia phyllosphaerae TaxID=3390502 RepID=UPI003978495D
MDATQLAITVAVVGLVLYKQFSGRFVAARDDVLPLVVIALGVVTLATTPVTVTAAGIALVAVEVVLAGALGVLRGRAFVLENRDGYLYRRGSVALAVAWALTIAVRVGASLVAGGLGAAALVGASSALVFGASLAVQAAVLHHRAAATGVPIRPKRASRTGA